MQNNPSADKIEQMLESLNGMKKAEAPPFLYTRVLARLERTKTSVWEKISMILARPTVAFACVVMVVILNLFAVFSQTQTHSVNPVNSSELVSTDEYSQVSNSFYDIENIKP